VSPDFYRVFYRTDRQAVARVSSVAHGTARQALGTVAAAGAASRSSLPCRLRKGQADAVERRTAAA